MRIIQTILVAGVVAVVHFIVQAHLFLSHLGLKLTWADAADPAFILGEQAKYLLSIVGFPLLWFLDALPISSIPYLEWGWLALNSGLWGITAYFLLRAFHKRVQQHAVIAGEVQIRRQWLMAAVVVFSLAVGSTFVRAVDSLLAHRFSPGLIDTTEAAIINTLEMGLMPLFVIGAMALMLRLSARQTLSLAWRTLLIGAVSGAIIGTTYAMGLQYATCGFIH